MPSLLEALEQKYGEGLTDSEGSEDEGISISIFVPCKSPRAIVPALLVLNDCDITTAGEREALIQKCSGVEELDLAKNKLNEWPEVFGILEQMPRLKFVNLSFNVLSTPLRQVEVDKSVKWQQLRNLVLNSTYIAWESVQDILEHLPRLEELHLSLNDYKDVHLHEKDCVHEDKNENTKRGCSCKNYKLNHKHSCIKVLHFNGNLIDSWEEVCKLGYAFPNLETLVLADCPIKSIGIDEDNREQPGCDNRNYERSESECESCNKMDAAHDGFRNLKVVNLNGTHLSSWTDIERLSKFPLLECIRVQACPLWETNEYTEHERRQLVIARLPNVLKLNGGGTITSEEREDSERAFIRYYMDKPESDQPERYFELVQIHGKLEPLVNIDLRPEKRVKVNFTCGSKAEVKSVDVYTTVSELKTKLESFAGFPASKMRLYYIDQDFKNTECPGLELMKFPNKRLYTYNIRSGDEILIDYKRKPHESISEEEEKIMYGIK